MAMEGTVKLPGIGPVKKKTAAYGSLSAVVLVLAIYWYRARKASSSKAATGATGTAGTSTDPAGNVGTIDPATGYVYGSAEDTAALASAGTGTAYNTSGLGSGGLSGYYYPPGGSTQATAPGPGNFADNAEWAQYVESYMISNLNADAATVGNAIGKYLTGQPVDPTQQNIIQEAIAVGDKPPQAGTGGYPPSIKTIPSGGGGGGTGPATGAVPGLHVLSTSREDISFQWNPVPGATSYSFGIPGMGSHQTNQTSATIHGLKPRTTYTVNVSASPSVSGKGHSSVTATTKAR